MFFQDLVLNLQQYWIKQGCLLSQPYDLEKGAGTFNPATFLRSLGPEPFSSVYIEPCRRPTDGRYGDNPLRLQHYYQLQVILKPSPYNIIDLYLDSLKVIGITPQEHDIRFVHDDWETTALGAWGLGWEVWCDGVEVTQFTYFQQIGGLELSLIPGEITYGLERLCMFLQKVDNVFNLQYNEHFTYGDIYHQNEIQFSKHNFEIAPVDLYLENFKNSIKVAKQLCQQNLPAPALDYVIKASHSFNILDSRNAISVKERQDYILKLRTLTQQVATSWVKSRKDLQFPFLQKENLIKKSINTTSSPQLNSIPKELKDLEQSSFLLEVGVEEMPAQVFSSLHKQLPELWKKYVTPLGLINSPPRFYSTPRRIAILVDFLQLKQTSEHKELKGPPLNIAQDKDQKWNSIAEGFVHTNKQMLKDIKIKTFGKFDYLTLNIHTHGKTAYELLQKTLPLMLSNIHWYKSMRWDSGTQTPFVRPVRWLVAMLDSFVIPFSFCGIKSQNKSYGHRFLSPPAFAVLPSNYERLLQEKYVIVNQKKRKNLLQESLLKKAQQNNLELIEDENLLEEVNQLIEYPFPILGSFHKKYLVLPKAVIISEMKEHQKYFSVKQKSSLAPYFIAVSNMKILHEDLASHNFSNVLNSRLFDGHFFLKEDSKKSLNNFCKDLSGMTFISEVGSMKEKVERIKSISLALAQKLKKPKVECDAITTAANLCKSDLLSKMVVEFPNLQGIIGKYYAQKEGYSPTICNAIEEHYLPKDAFDELPHHIEGALIGIADRLDTIVSLFLINKKPTGSADPYALRRSCIACLHLLIQYQLKFSLPELIEITLQQHSSKPPTNLQAHILEFFKQRFKYILQNNNRNWLKTKLSHEQINAIVQSSSPWSQVSNTMVCIQTILETPPSTIATITSYTKRIANILHHYTDSLNEIIHPDLLLEKAEQSLFQEFLNKKILVQNKIKNQEYSSVIHILKDLQTPVDLLFDTVMINDPDKHIKQNRMSLLHQVQKLSSLLIDFTALP